MLTHFSSYLFIQPTASASFCFPCPACTPSIPQSIPSPSPLPSFSFSCHRHEQGSFVAHLFAPTTAINPPPYYNKPAGIPETGLYTRLGQTGAVVSRICLGLMSYTDEKPMFPWMLDAAKGEEFVKQALDAGINFFDTGQTIKHTPTQHTQPTLHGQPHVSHVSDVLGWLCDHS